MAPSSSLVRKPDLQSGNEEFESPRGHHMIAYELPYFRYFANHL